MEEWVGNLWHRFITQKAETGFPQAVVKLDEVLDTAPIFFRALGGDSGVQIKNALNTENTSRSFLQRVAGTHTKTQLAYLEQDILHLPEEVQVFEEEKLNRHLYLWLIALSLYSENADQAWFLRNKNATAKLLKDLPAWRAPYQRMVSAFLATRSKLHAQPSETAIHFEKALAQALTHPEQTIIAPRIPASFEAVPLWLHPTPPLASSPVKRSLTDDDTSDGDAVRKEQQNKQRKGEAAKNNTDEAPMVIFFRAESILSWAENIGVNRSSDDEEDDLAAADELDSIAVQSDNKSRSSRVKFDLDLPSAAADDYVVREGFTLPEWDYKQQQLIEKTCHVEEVLPRDSVPCGLPIHLTKEAKRIKQQFQTLTPLPERLYRQNDGESFDLDALVQHQVERKLGHAYADDGLYIQRRHRHRDLSCLLLADLSRSTESGINDDKRVIDVIKDSTFLFAEALHACGDTFAMLGFSSRRRDPIRISLLKGFQEKYNAEVRGRIEAIKPGYYTRMGAAIRYATLGLQVQKTKQKLLLILSDGKPNDIDEYEGRYGIEDTRHAILEAKQRGITPFCLTIDRKGGQYLPYLFGAQNFVLVRKTEDLPVHLLTLYRQITGNVH